MLVRVIRFLIIVAATLAWLTFTERKSYWLMFAGLVVIIGVAELTHHLMKPERP
jgi:drug/metabolite transporter (DMT)-like permease